MRKEEMIKFKKIFLPILLIIYVIVAYFIKDNQKSLIIVTVFFAIISSIFITMNLTKRK